MPKYCVIDTEGTGFFKYKDPDTGLPVPADAPGQPRLASLAMIFLDEDLVETDVVELFVKPDSWEMPAEAQAVNGLSTEFLHENGTPVAIVLERYIQAIDDGYVIVSYNAQHDCKQMRAEMRRAEIDDRFDRTPNICCMRASKAAGVERPDGNRRAFPKLEHACAYFDIELTDAHTAGGDARACLEVFRKLHEMDALPEAKVHFAKNAPAKADAAPVAEEKV